MVRIVDFRSVENCPIATANIGILDFSMSSAPLFLKTMWHRWRQRRHGSRSTISFDPSERGRLENQYKKLSERTSNGKLRCYEPLSGDFAQLESTR